MKKGKQDNALALIKIIESYQKENIRMLDQIRQMELILKKTSAENHRLRGEIAKLIKSSENRRILFLLFCLFGIAATFRFIAPIVALDVWASIVSLAILITILAFSGLFMGFLSDKSFADVLDKVFGFLTPTIPSDPGSGIDIQIGKEGSKVTSSVTLNNSGSIEAKGE